jgi:hypothetical protein
VSALVALLLVLSVAPESELDRAGAGLIRQPGSAVAQARVSELALESGDADALVRLLRALRGRGDEAEETRARLADATLGLLLAAGHAREARSALGRPAERLRRKVAELDRLRDEVARLRALEEGLRVVGPGAASADELLEARRAELLDLARLHARMAVELSDEGLLRDVAAILPALLPAPSAPSRDRLGAAFGVESGP